MATARSDGTLSAWGLSAKVCPVPVGFERDTRQPKALVLTKASGLGRRCTEDNRHQGTRLVDQTHRQIPPKDGVTVAQSLPCHASQRATDEKVLGYGINSMPQDNPLAFVNVAGWKLSPGEICQHAIAL